MIDQETKNVHVIKDCWVEDRPEKQMEHDIVAGIKNDMGDDNKFHKYFIDICGYQKTDTSGGFGNICNILNTRTLLPIEDFEIRILVLASDTQNRIYTNQTNDSIAKQDHLLQPTPTKKAPQSLPHPRFHYQVVYGEKGKSLFEVSSFVDVFVYISQAAEGMWPYSMDLQILTI